MKSFAMFVFSGMCLSLSALLIYGALFEVELIKAKTDILFIIAGIYTSFGMGMYFLVSGISNCVKGVFEK